MRDVDEDHFIVTAEKARGREDRPVIIELTSAKILGRRKLGPDGNKLGPDAYVFGNDVGEVISKERVCKMWRARPALRPRSRIYTSTACARNLRPRCRNGGATRKVPIEGVRDALGHSSITMTNTYLRSRASSLKDAYRKRTQHQARKRLKVIKGNGPRLAHNDHEVEKAASS